MTILHYTGSKWDGSGIHAVIRQQALVSADRLILGVAPDFVAQKFPRLSAWRGPAIADETIDPANAGRALRVAWRVRRWLGRGTDRVFHGHSRAGLLVALWLRLLGQRRVVVTVHAYGRQRWFYRFAAFVLGPRLVWLTPAMKKHYGLADASWAGCIPNGLAAPPAEALRRWPGGRPLRVGGAGMLVGWKRWDLVLQALARLPGDRAVEFYHAGGTVDAPESQACAAALKRLAADPRLAGRVHWLGWQDSAAALLARVDVVVVPSDGEPFSMIALEALFAGVPVIATRGGGPEDFIVEGGNGWLVPAGDPAALAARLEACLDPAAWRTLQTDPGHLRRFFVPDTLAAQWSAFYSAL